MYKKVSRFEFQFSTDQMFVFVSAGQSTARTVPSTTVHCPAGTGNIQTANRKRF